MNPVLLSSRLGALGAAFSANTWISYDFCFWRLIEFYGVQGTKGDLSFVVLLLGCQMGGDPDGKSKSQLKLKSAKHMFEWQ